MIYKLTTSCEKFTSHNRWIGKVQESLHVCAFSPKSLLFAYTIQATPAMSTSRISILSLMSKWFFIPNIFSLYIFSFQLCLCRKGLTWSNGYLEVIFHALDIFFITFATACVKVKNRPLQGRRIVCCGYVYALPEVRKSSKQWSKTIKSVKTSFDWAITLLFSAIKSIHCFDTKSHSIPIKRNDIDNQLFTFNWPTVITLIVHTIRCVRIKPMDTKRHICNFNDWTRFNGILWWKQ